MDLIKTYGLRDFSPNVKYEESYLRKVVSFSAVDSDALFTYLSALFTYLCAMSAKVCLPKGPGFIINTPKMTVHDRQCI